jgi:hypothetical protein
VRSSPYEALLAALAALALALGLTWPVALHPTAHIVGHPGNDGWNHIWGYWWVAESLLSGDWPDQTGLLAWPRGGTLWFIDTVQVVLSLPLQLIGGPVLAYNAVVIVGLAFAAFAAWLLARQLTRDAAASTVALVVYGASPHLLGQAYNGISETVCAGWLPFTLWALLRVLDRPSWGRAAVLGLSAGLCMLTSWYYGLFAGLAGGVVLATRGVTRPYLVDWRAAAPRLAAAVALAGALVAPGFLAFQRSLGAADAIVSRDPEFVWNSLLFHNITDLAAFFRPGRTPSPDLFAMHGEELVIVIYLGWAGLLLAGFAALATRRHREFGAWLWLGLLFFLFSLGPYLNVGGEYLQVFGRRIPLPFLALFEAFPVFDRISHPFRFVVGVSLAVAMLAAVGLRHALRARSPRARLGVAAAVSVLMLVEFGLGSPAHLPVPTADARVPAVYAAMADDPVPGAVLDLPLTVPNLERAVYVWYQADHRRPVPWGLNDPMPSALLANRLMVALMQVEATRATSLPAGLPALDLIVSGRALARQGYRYVVLHEDLYPAFKRHQAEALLTGVYGPPVRHADDALLVWTLPEDLVMEAFGGVAAASSGASPASPAVPADTAAPEAAP